MDESEETLRSEKRAEIVVYCMNEGCGSSREEVRELTDMGYKHVRHHAGGEQEWVKAVLPIEGKRPSDREIG